MQTTSHARSDYVPKYIEGDILEFRDKEAYMGHLVDSPKIYTQERFFNKIVIDRENGILEKSITNKNYEHLIQKEIIWYREAEKRGIVNIPEFIGIVKDSDNGKTEGFQLRYLKDYKTLYHYLDKTNDVSIIQKITSRKCMKFK